MSITLLAHVFKQSTDGLATTTADIDTTNATLLVALVSAASGHTGISDNKSNTWTPDTVASNTSEVRCFYVANPTVGTGHHFVGGDVTSCFPSVGILAFSGTDGSARDQSNSNTATASSVATNSVTPSTDNQVVITGLSDSDTGSVSINGGFTISDQGSLVGGAAYGLAVAYLIQTTATAANPTWTGSISSTLSAVIDTFKATASTDTLFAQACL